MLTLVWRQSARDDARAIFNYIAERSKPAAERLQVAIEACAERLPEHPVSSYNIVTTSRRCYHAFQEENDMRTALRKMGNSTGMIVPKAILSELGAQAGTTFDISVQGNKIVASPVRSEVRAGWAEAAALIGAANDPAAEEWLDLANEADDDWTW